MSQLSLLTAPLFSIEKILLIGIPSCYFFIFIVILFAKSKSTSYCVVCYLMEIFSLNFYALSTESRRHRVQNLQVQVQNETKPSEARSKPREEICL